MGAPTVIEILNKTAGHFRQNGIENFRLDAQLLLAEVLHLDRIELYLNYDRPLTDKEINNCRSLVRRRAAREPLQHILGKVQFRELVLKVDKRALIPRRETEQIIDSVKDALNSLSGLQAQERKISILDVGVGSGAIFLSLRKEFPNTLVFGVELHKDALSLAKENAVLNKLEADCVLKQGDTFQPFPPAQKWDIIVSNPPYVASHDFANLDPEVKFWDPPHALIGGESGTKYPSRLIREAHSRTNHGGFLIMEMGDGQAQLFQEEAERCNWKHIRVNYDYSGKKRFLVLRK